MFQVNEIRGAINFGSNMRPCVGNVDHFLSPCLVLPVFARIASAPLTSEPILFFIIYDSVILIFFRTIRNGWNDSRSSTPSSRGGYGGGGRGGYDRERTYSSFGSRGGHSGGGGGAGGAGWGNERSASTNGWYGNQPRGDGQPRDNYGFGVWKDGIHLPGGRNMRMEKDLYGDPNDPSKQHTGINFEKYDDIPVEATGAGVPEPVTTFTNPPLAPVLLENIGYARYTVPTPVQKYSIPIVAAGRDLMACAQVSDPSLVLFFCFNVLGIDWLW